MINPHNIVPRYMEPALEKAGLRRFRFHDLRRTFGSLFIQDGASLPYVKDQMGHSSIQITVDTNEHLIPGADIAWGTGSMRKQPRTNHTRDAPSGE